VPAEVDLRTLTSDEAIEILIGHATRLLRVTALPRLVDVQRALIAMRSPEQVARMEKEPRLG